MRLFKQRTPAEKLAIKQRNDREAWKNGAVIGDTQKKIKVIDRNVDLYLVTNPWNPKSKLIDVIDTLPF